jgi:hypothetical protein
MRKVGVYKLGAGIIAAVLCLFAVFAPAPGVQAAEAQPALSISEQAARGMVFSTVGSCGCEVQPQGAPAMLGGWKPQLVEQQAITYQ